MPNIKSAKKRVKVNDKKRDENRILKSELATKIKNFKNAVEKDNTDADKKLIDVCSYIDNACAHGIIHKNNADRKKSRLAIFVNKAKNNTNN